MEITYKEANAISKDLNLLNYFNFPGIACSPLFNCLNHGNTGLKV